MTRFADNTHKQTKKKGAWLIDTNPRHAGARVPESAVRVAYKEIGDYMQRAQADQTKGVETAGERRAERVLIRGNAPV